MAFDEGGVRHDHRRRAAVEARRIAGGDRAAVAKGRTQTGQSLEGRLRPRRFIPGERLDAGLALDLHGRDLLLETARLPGRAKPPLRAFGEAILGLAGQLQQRHEILRVPARMPARKSVLQTVMQHRVMDFGGPHPVTPAAIVEQVGRAVHVFESARDRAIDLAAGDLLRRRDDGLRARSADPIDRHGRNRNGKAAAERRLTGGVHPAAGLDDMAHDHAADGVGIGPGPLQDGAHGDGAERCRRHAPERAVERPDGRADRMAELDLALGSWSASPAQAPF